MAFRAGNHDRAWNDPPLFSYQQGDSSSDIKPNEKPNNSSRKNLLNKRIAFPLSGGLPAARMTMTTPPIGVTPPISTPPITTLLKSPPTNFTAVLNEQSNSTLDAREQLNSSLLKISHILHDSLVSHVESEKQEDFTRRLQNLYTCWKDGKVTEDIRRRLTTICDFLEAKDFVRAENVRVALAVDYTAECAGWIMVIKNIINQMETKQID